MSKALANSWRRYRALPPLGRELATFGLMLLLALTLLPLAIYFAGQVFLGEYIRDPSGSPSGGFWALWSDYLRGVFGGSTGHLLVLLGPWLLLLFFRACAALGRRDRGSRSAAP